jgi:hypothetical protein
MTTKTLAYDHPVYLVRQALPGGVNVAGSGDNTTVVNVPFSGSTVFSATFTVTTAGTSTANNLFTVSKTSGTTTTVLGTATLGTATAGSVVNIALSATAGGVALLQGDRLFATSGTDVVGVAVVTYELGIAPFGAITN